jgi:HK97 family phage prohead protease
MEPDFSGYVTRYGIKCTDGRTILAHAFKDQDKAQIPLVWQHQHDAPDNVLGHLILQHKDDGVYAHGFFNETENGKKAKALVEHKDVKAMSIFANRVKQQGSNVTHGNLCEGSLVMAGANPGAFIDNVYIQHGDGTETTADGEIVIYTGEELEHAASSTTVSGPRRVGTPKPPMPTPSGTGNSTDDSNKTVADVINDMTDEQKNAVYALVGEVVNHTDSPNDPEGNPVPRNVFDQNDDKTPSGPTLSHADTKGIFAAAQKTGSLRDAIEQYVVAHGIDDISTLFPYDQAVTDTPEFISRRMEWVNGVLTGTRKTPFSRIRSWTADITQDEARAKGYIKGNLKKEEFFSVSRRITTPQTIYKKQKLDRDDILDITDFDVVNWLQTEMRVMLDEELARAILIGDGREVDDPDKISETNVRPILGDDEMYVTQINVASSVISGTDLGQGPDAIVDAVVNGMRFYRGSGTPTLFTTLLWQAKMLLAKDQLGRRLYATTAELAAALGVRDVIACEALEVETDLIGIIVNLQDYTIGADRGGQVSMFDFFDIDYNQFKYLMETRVSGAMTKYKGALVVMQFEGAGGVLPDPPAPAFDETTGIATVPTVSHVTYVTVDGSGTESSALTAGAQTAIASGATVHYRAKAASTYTFSDGASEDWFFTRE